VNNLYKGFILVILAFSLFSFSVNKEEVDLWNKFALFNSDFDKFNGSNLTWFSKLIRKDRMVEVGDRFTLGSEIEYNIGIKYFDSNHKKIQFIRNFSNNPKISNNLALNNIITIIKVEIHASNMAA
jgi:hypothetical protein